tara:strand:- start:2349 stop:3143 length:795 start_codon:yes stop_codon:yes gene_type:complete
MNENETKTTTPEVTAVPEQASVAATEAVVKKSNIKLYVGTFLIVGVIFFGVLYLLEKEGRSSTSIFSSVIEAQEAKKVVAVVNGEEIINADLQTSVDQFSQMAAAQGVDITNPSAQAEIRSQSLEVLINTELLLQEADNRQIEIAQSELDARLDDIVEQMGGQDALDTRMVELGIDAETLRVDIEEELLIQELLDQVFVEASIEVTEEEILEVYDTAGGEEGGLPALEEVREQVQAQIITSKEQSAIDAFIVDLKEGSDIEIIE